jgi:hypothetical protein
MKIVSAFLILFILVSCGVKVPYTDNLKKEYNLNEENMKKVQFYTSTTIILEKSQSSGSQGTGQGGTLVTNQSSEQVRVIIPTNTKCIFEKFGDKGEVYIRFEVGQGRTLKYALRPNLSNGKYYLEADWKDPKGGKLEYGNDVYYATNASGNAFLLVVVKKLQKTKRKDRVVKGIKV